MQDKAQTLNEVWPLISFLFEEPTYDPKARKKVMVDGAKPALEDALEALRGTQPFEPGEIEAAMAPVLAARDLKPGKLYQPIRVAISGGTVSPGIFESLSVLGKDRSIARIERALAECWNSST